MATTHWTNGAGTNVWGTAANWDNGVPVAATDLAVIGSRSNASINGATVAGPAKVEVADTYTGDIGSSGTPLLLGTNDTPEFNYHGSGKLFLGATGAGITIDRLKIRSRSKATDAVNLYITSSGAITDLFLLSGKVNVVSAVITNCYIDWVQSQNSDVNLDVQSGAGLITNLNMGGGVVTAARTITNVYMHGGVCSFSQGNITTLCEIQNGTLVYNSSAGTIGGLVVYSRGRVDLTRTNDVRTISTTRIHSGGYVDVRGVANSITFSTAPILVGQGSEIRGTQGVSTVVLN